MIAALQMYDWPEVHGRLDAFWDRVSANLTAAGLDAPAALSRPDSISESWAHPDLVLGQTCGLPYVSGRCGDAVLVARPVYGIAGAMDGTYSSALICRKDDRATSLADFRGRKAAVNEYGSQSGCNALADAVLDVHHDADSPFFGEVLLSGAHRTSARMVADAAADIAAIDAVAWALFAELDPNHHARLRVVAWTRPMPALPFIVSKNLATHHAVLTQALTESCCAGAPAPLPTAVKPAVDSDYDPIRQMNARVRGLRLAAGATPLRT